MDKKIIVLYDTTLKKCDKLWVAKGLRNRGYEVRVLTCPCYIFKIEKKGKVGKLLAKVLITLQCIYAILVSRKEDTIFCWNHWTGLIMNMLIGEKRHIISYNWLTPQVNPRTRHIYAKALENPNLTAIINCEENYEHLINDYQVEDKKNIFYIPDVYDDNAEFKTPHMCDKKAFCFMGGVENRDWELFFSLAVECPELDFVGVTSKNVSFDFHRFPSNVRMYYDLNTEEYYKLMEDAYLCICLLKEERVSGLINVLKAAQLGKIMLISKNPVTKLYYPEEYRSFLISDGNVEAIKEKINMVYNFNAAQYIQAALKIQEFIQKEYSPERALDNLQKIIDS